MTADIVSLRPCTDHLAELRHAEDMLRILATSLLAADAFDESEAHDALQDIAERIAGAADTAEAAGQEYRALLRIESGLRIVATALFAEVNANPARDASTLHDALVDIADRLADATDAQEHSDIAARRAA